MAKYIGVKVVDAEHMTLGDYNIFRGWTIPDDEDPNKEGFKVVYKDGYVSWSPKEAFLSYFNIHKSDSITQIDVDSWIKNTDVTTVGEKTTVVRTTLINGFELIEASSCVDPKNYDEKLGSEICLDKIKDKIWFLLGFLLQCSKGHV